MELGSIIESVRKSKGLTVKDVCGNEVSRSVYNRFVNNRADTSTKNLSYLLGRLNLYYDELRNFDYPKGAYKIQKISEEVKIAFWKKEVKELEQIMFICEQEIGENQIKYQHVSSLCELLIARVKNTKIDVTQNQLYQYLINVQSWTHYELVLFNNVMYAFDIDFLQVILDKAILNLKQYSTLDRYGNESFRMISNAIIYFISNDDIKNVSKYVKVLNVTQLKEDALFEKMLLLLINGIWHCIVGEKELGNKEIEQSLYVCKLLNADDLYKMNHDLVLFLNRKYEWKIQV
jgi:Rgg/GadR/MutR family transcriptional activator